MAISKYGKGTFQLRLSGGAEVLQNMARGQVEKSAKAIAARAESMMQKTTTGDAPGIEVNTEVAQIKRGQRAVATVTISTPTSRDRAIAKNILAKAVDAGKVR